MKTGWKLCLRSETAWDRKCLGKLRRSFAGHPERDFILAKLFLGKSFSNTVRGAKTDRNLHARARVSGERELTARSEDFTSWLLFSFLHSHCVHRINCFPILLTVNSHHTCERNHRHIPEFHQRSPSTHYFSRIKTTSESGWERRMPRTLPSGDQWNSAICSDLKLVIFRPGDGPPNG